jgi:putative ABC transport system ATP-binding protein
VLLEARNIERSFLTDGKTYIALAPLTLSVAASEFLVVTGKSGSGKSTLLNLLSGLDKPSHGEVMFEGVPLSLMKEREIAHLRNSCFGFIFQTPHLLPEKTVLENVALPFRYGQRAVRVNVEKRCNELLEYVGLNRFGLRYPNTLSGGEMQRVVFARALARSPKIIFADEPTGSLDSRNSKKILQLLKKQVERGYSVIMASHDADAVQYGTRIIHLVKHESCPKQIPV